MNVSFYCSFIEDFFANLELFSKILMWNTIAIAKTLELAFNFRLYKINCKRIFNYNLRFCLKYQIKNMNVCKYSKSTCSQGQINDYYQRNFIKRQYARNNNYYNRKFIRKHINRNTVVGFGVISNK